FEELVEAHDISNPPMANVVLYAACNLLSKPCRRDELRTVALLCNTGFALCRKTYRTFRKRLPGSVAPDSAVRFRDALIEYAGAADLLNDAVGAVLFEGLHAELEA